MMQKVAWKAKKSRCGIVVPARGANADVAQERVVEAADEARCPCERERVADERPGHRDDAERARCSS